MEGTGYEKASKKNILSFQKILAAGGINVTLRRTLGRDIEAACGQLRRAEDENPVSYTHLRHGRVKQSRFSRYADVLFGRLPESRKYHAADRRR